MTSIKVRFPNPKNNAEAMEKLWTFWSCVNHEWNPLSAIEYRTRVATLATRIFLLNDYKKQLRLFSHVYRTPKKRTTNEDERNLKGRVSQHSDVLHSIVLTIFLFFFWRVKSLLYAIWLKYVLSWNVDIEVWKKKKIAELGMIKHSKCCLSVLCFLCWNLR